MASFIRAEKLVDLTPQQLVSLDVGAVTNNLDLKYMFVGKKTRDQLKDYKRQSEFLILASSHQGPTDHVEDTYNRNYP